MTKATGDWVFIGVICAMALGYVAFTVWGWL